MIRVRVARTRTRDARTHSAQQAVVHEALQIRAAARVAVVHVGHRARTRVDDRREIGVCASPTAALSAATRPRVAIAQERRQRMAGAQRAIDARAHRDDQTTASAGSRGPLRRRGRRHRRCRSHCRRTTSAAADRRAAATHLALDERVQIGQERRIERVPDARARKARNSTVPARPSAPDPRPAARRESTTAYGAPAPPASAARIIYESPPEPSKSLSSLNAPTELNPYGRGNSEPAAHAVSTAGPTRCAPRRSPRAGRYRPRSHRQRDKPSRRVSRITVFTPSMNVARPSGPISHVRRAPAGRARRQKPVGSATGGSTNSKPTPDIRLARHTSDPLDHKHRFDSPLTDRQPCIPASAVNVETLRSTALERARMGL